MEATLLSGTGGVAGVVLGIAGALAGSSLPIAPQSTAAQLGFSRAFENSLDAVSGLLIAELAEA